MRLVAPRAVLVCAVGCSGPSAVPETPAASAAPTVQALSPQAAWLVAQVGGDRVTVHSPLPPGEDAATWFPPGDVVAGLAAADLIVANGAGHETWIKTATLPTGRLVDSALGLDLIEVPGPTHSHGKQGEHSHADVDPRTWTDPAVFAGQAAAVHRALVRADPAGKDVYDEQIGTLQTELATLGQELDAALGADPARRLIAGHSEFRYLARRVAAVADADPTPDPSLDALRVSTADGTYDYLARSRANVARFRAAAASSEP